MKILVLNALHFDPRRGVVLMSSLGERGEVTATSILQFDGRVVAEIVRVLIRPSDLTLTLSTEQKAASELTIRRRETA